MGVCVCGRGDSILHVNERRDEKGRKVKQERQGREVIYKGEGEGEGRGEREKGRQGDLQTQRTDKGGKQTKGEEEEKRDFGEVQTDGG